MKIKPLLAGFICKKSHFNEYIRVMKISLSLLFICTFQLVATTLDAQNATVEIGTNHLTVKELIREIEKQTEFLVLYRNNDVNTERVVRVNGKSNKVSSVLDAAFKDSDISYEIQNKYILLAKKADKTTSNFIRQTGKRITGTVVDEMGEPAIGANILEKGVQNGVITDLNGKFDITVQPSATLVVSYIGYTTQEVVVGNQTNITIRLTEDTQSLEEVVVVGYGKMTRKDITSSITTIKADDLNKGGVYTSPGQLLQGKVPGLSITTSSDPNASPSLVLRGASTFRSDQSEESATNSREKSRAKEAQEPYYVIDGIPGASIALVSPDDIETIDVLRDASATAIYGSKAANGVIIITTKRGIQGAASVTYNGYVAIDQVSSRWDMMSASEHRQYLSANGLTMSSADYIDETTNTNWQKQVQRTGVSHNHNVSISGGYEKTTYSASINYMENEGVIKGTDMDRLIGRAMVNTSTFKDRLDLGFSINASITNQNKVWDQKDGLSVLDAMTYYLPESPVYNTNGTYFENLAHSQYYNPVALIGQNEYKIRNKRLQGVAKGTLHILPELTLDANMSYQSETENENIYNDIASNVNQNSGGYAKRNTYENTQKNLEVFANYNKTFADVHKVGAMIGYSWQENNYDDGFQVTSKGFTSDALGYYNLAMGSSTDRPDYGTAYNTTLRMISFFGRLNYSFNSKYMFQGTVRRDGSSAFGANNRWGSFPSASLAWRMSEESFIKDLGVFDDLKFRVGYGVSGNSLGFDPLYALVLYGKSGSFTNSNGQTVSAIGATRNANPNLKWERTSMFNIGLDFGFFNNRLTGTIEYYDKRTSDLIANYAVSTTKYLVSWMTANVGEISNKGLELSLHATPVQTRKFSWNTSVNLSHNKNRVESISNSEFSVDYFDQAELNAPGQSGARQQRIMAGETLGTFYTWKWAGYNEDGVSVFYTKDGETTTTPGDEDRVKTGSAQPKLNLGWNNSLNYKNWSMTMFFTGVFGNDIMNGTRARLSRISGATERNLLKDAAKEQKPTDTNAHYLSDRWIEKGDYFRLSNLSVAYNFRNFGDYIKNLRVYASCSNVFVITGYKGLDPEVNLGGLTPGIDNKNFYPKTRTFMFGATLTF